MKIFKCLTPAIVAALSTVGFAQYDSNRVNLWSQIPLTAMPGSPSSGAGCTGYVSPNGHEYAIMGVRTGTLIVDITVPKYPIVISLVTGATSLWHENTVLGDYAYLVSDQTGPGIQIVDLTQVDTTRSAPVVATYSGNNLSTIHTIQANPASKTLYVNGSNRGLVFLDATNPTNLVEVGRWTTKYVHDCTPVNYTSGPWAGKEILMACCGTNGFYILDVTNKANVVVLSHLQYLASGGYCHSGMLTPDKRYYLINDEFDENNGVVAGATTHVIDIQDLANPVEVTQFHNPISVIDHNSMFQDGYMFLASYRGGLRIYDPTDPLALREIAYFDTYPGPDAYSYDGAWGTCAKFPSGNVIISDINRGLFVVDPSEAKGLGAPIFDVDVPSRSAAWSIGKTLRTIDSVYSRLLPGNHDLTFKTASPERSTLTLTYAGLKRNTEVVNIQLKNLVTGNYDTIFTPALTTTRMTFSSGPFSSANYIDANGQVFARIAVSVDPSQTQYGGTDMLRLDVSGSGGRRGGGLQGKNGDSKKKPKS